MGKQVDTKRWGDTTSESTESWRNFVSYFFFTSMRTSLDAISISTLWYYCVDINRVPGGVKNGAPLAGTTLLWTNHNFGIMLFYDHLAGREITKNKHAALKKTLISIPSHTAPSCGSTYSNDNTASSCAIIKSFDSRTYLFPENITCFFLTIIWRST